MAPESPPPASGPDVLAAGAVVVRRGEVEREVLLVHRPKYDDWSFPKGKQERDEHITATAVREVLEETGVEIRLARPLRPQLYAVSGGRQKKVQYWIGQVVGDDDVSTYEVNEEVDEVGWFPVHEAKERLTYLDDLDLLEQWAELPKRTTALLVVRHAKAVKRGQWGHADPKRPLNDVGEAQAAALSPVLLAYGVAHVVSSPSTRCLQTVRPYAEEQVLGVDEYDELSEEGHDKHRAARLLERVLDSTEPTVICSHRPVLPDLFDLLGFAEEPLSPAEVVVAHHRKGRIVATERHLPR
jgi:8-oxo-dGTP pyrophosphatase MutT (NUDIX family)/phosphohistidine phosphatase SixA